MAEIAGVTVDWTASPRIIKIPLAVRSVSAQDLLDTCRTLEASLDALDDDNLVDSAEGEVPLDDVGTQTVITLTLLNAQVYFIPDTVPISTGTATAASSTVGRTITLTDGVATFQADGAARGDTIFNSTTGGMATVLTAPLETTLQSLPLTGGSRDDWQIGDVWTLYNNEQAKIDGGNVVAIDDAILRNFLSPVLEAPNVQIVRSSASSGTVQELSAIQYSSFNGGVWVMSGGPNSGTAYPVGTPEFPVNNMADAHAIADSRGFTKIYFLANMTLSAEDFSDGHIFIGRSTTLTSVTLNAGANVTNCEFQNMTITGTLDGGNTLRECIVQNVSVVQGSLIDCGLSGTATLGGSAPVQFINCNSWVAGTDTPVIDLGGTGQDFLMRGYKGGIKFINKTGPDPFSLDMDSGQVKLDWTIMAGTLTLRGVGTLTEDYSGGTATVDNQMLSPGGIAFSIWSEDLSTYLTDGTAGRIVSKIFGVVRAMLGMRS